MHWKRKREKKIKEGLLKFMIEEEISKKIRERET